MQKLGRYEIIDELGRGGCGVVYRATDPKIGRQVAIKTIVATSGDDPTATSDLLMRLRREAQSAGALSHPNIVTVHELAEEGDTTYIVMEHVTGQNLRQVMSAGRLPDQSIVGMLHQAADALDYAHSQGVVHRDVKPANFLLTGRGVVKVTDFGIAKLLSGENTGVTQTGMMIGTTHYMAPEQIAMTPVDGRTDQFALGVMAYEMLTGQRPFQGDSFASIIHQVLSVDPPPLEKYRETIGPEATLVLRRSLAKKPEERYPSCTDFVRDLGAALLGADGAAATMATGTFANATSIPVTLTALHPALQGAPAAASTPTASVPAPKASKRGLVWVLAAVAVAAVALLSYRTLRPTADQPATPVVTQATPPPAPDVPPSAVPSPPVPAPAAAAPARNEVAPARKEPAAEVPRPAPVQTPKVTAPAVQPPVEDASSPAGRGSSAPTAPSVPDPELPPGGRYRGPPEGNIAWSGTLAPRATLVMAGPRASSGAIAGRGLPVGIALSLEVAPAEIRVVELPTPANRYRLVLANSGRSEVSAVTIRWRERHE